MTPRQQQISALAHAAHTLNRLFVQKRNWAAEAQLAGKSDLAAKWREEALLLRLDAVWHLGKAQGMKDTAHYFEETE